MTHSIQYTTIPDMRNRLGVDVQQLSYAMSVGTIGGMFGGPLGSLADRLVAMNSWDAEVYRQFRHTTCFYLKLSRMQCGLLL